MILITGGTGFIGKALIRQLSELEYPLRILIRPSARTPNLPTGVPVEAAVSSLADPRGLRAAMVGVEAIYHLASSERQGALSSLMDIDIQGTRNLVDSAVDAGVKRFFFVSHLGADRGSAYPVLKAKGITEDYLKRSGLNYTIIRSAIAYGRNDGLTTGIARVLAATPWFFLLPGSGQTLLQPVWVEDLATGLAWALEDDETANRSLDLGGPEYLTFQHVVELVMEKIHIRRQFLKISPPYLRGFTVLMESIFPGFPTTVYWLDYLAANRTTGLDTLPRQFGLLPSRMSQRLDYLGGQNWEASLARTLIRRRV